MTQNIYTLFSYNNNEFKNNQIHYQIILFHILKQIFIFFQNSLSKTEIKFLKNFMFIFIKTRQTHI